MISNSSIMKKYLLLAFLLTAACMLQAQTKGTNTLGLGIGIQNYKFSESFAGTGTVTNQQITGLSMSYGQFSRQNEKAGIDLFYGSSEFSRNPANTYNTYSYGGKLTYQKYVNLTKSLYAFGGGRGGYNYSEARIQGQGLQSDFSNAVSSLGAYGGVSWFLSKRFALEADLLSADIAYIKTTEKSRNENGLNKITTGTFNLSSAGAVSTLGFKIHFLF